MTRLAILLVTSAALVGGLSLAPAGPELARRVGAGKCKACRTCERCRHCDAGNGACGVCAHHESLKY